MAERTSETMVPAMTTTRAARVLREYNEWRREDDQPRDLPYTGKEIGLAIDTAVYFLSKHQVNADIEDIVRYVKMETGITEDELCSSDRHRRYSEARAVITWLARNYTPMSITAIGRRLKRHHASVVNYTHLVDEWLKHPNMNKRVVDIIRAIQNELEQ